MHARITFLTVLWCIYGGLAQAPVNKAYQSLSNIIKESKQAYHEYDLAKSISLASCVLEEAAALHDTLGHNLSSQAYNMIGGNYSFIWDKEEAMKAYTKALYHADKINNDTLKQSIYNNMAVLFVRNDQNNDQALRYYQKAIDASPQSPVDNVRMQTLLLNICDLYIKKGKVNIAEKYIQQIEPSIESTKQSPLVPYFYFLKGNTFAHQHKYDKAEFYFDEAIAMKDLQDPNILAELYYTYANMLSDIGKEKESIQMFKTFIEAKQKLTRTEVATQQKIANARYKLNEYQNNVKELEQQTQIAVQQSKMSQNLSYFTLFVSFILVICLVSVLYFYFSKNKLSKKLQTQNIELEAQKDRAEQLAKTKSQFISTVSHELRTPLYGVVGLTSLLMDNSNLRPEDKQYLKSLKFSGDYLLNLVNDVLQLSKIENKKVSVNSIRFDLLVLVQNLVQSFQQELEDRKNQLHLQIDSDVPIYLVGDTIRISQILMNLVGNAVKFTSEGSIWLRIKLKKQIGQRVYLRFEIQDEGPGIPESEYHKIFENFSQLDRHQDDSQFKGTGLGLAIVTKLLDLLNSKIELYSVVGEGTTFGFDLKLEISEQIIPAKVDLDEASQNHRILIAEDNKVNQIVTRKILERKNFSVEVVGNGEEAIQAVKKSHFDLILMDIHMPVLDGIQATVEIRKFNPDIPIIALTASEIEEIDTEIFSKGISDVVVKPFETDEFFAKIYKLCRNSISRAV